MLDFVERYTRGDRPDVLKGVLAGAAGGFVGSLRMGRLVALWNNMNAKLEDADSSRLKPVVKKQAPRDDPLPSYGDGTQAKATRDTAGAAIETATGRPATQQEEAIGGAIVHGMTGVLAGAVYGAAVELVPALRKGYGLPLGVGTYLLGRQLGMTAAGLAPAPTKQPAADQLVALGSHLAYGVFAELTRHALRSAIADD